MASRPKATAIKHSTSLRVSKQLLMRCDRARQCEEIELAWRKTLSVHGIEKDSRLGYSIGVAYTPTWGERTASIRRGDRTVLQTGVVFHLMAGLWLEDTGITITQSFVVTEDGYEPLTKRARDLIVKD
ncbi:M24 family metallopeptidase [Mesorhizobium sp.]|uniref:M24 family metallopeptidase n=1 Tax=Mesorhizobium sp. TaxID=1871066 RepID=UPI0034303A7F